MVLGQRWAATGSDLGQPTYILSPPEVAAEVYAPVSWYQLTTHLSAAQLSTAVPFTCSLNDKHGKQHIGNTLSLIHI